MKKMRTEPAVSPVIGTILLLIIAIGAMSIVYMNVLSDDGPAIQRYVTVVGTVEGTDMVIEHRGGENLPIEHISLDIMFRNETLHVDLEGNLSAEARADGYWGLGERIIVPFPLENISDYENIQADVMAVDEQINNIAFIGNLDLDVVSDVEIRIMTNESNPHIGQKVMFTVSVINPEGIVDAENVSVLFQLPESFTYSSHFVEKGSYDPDTGIWELGDLQLNHASIELQVTADFIGSGVQEELTQLCILVDGSGSVRNADWNIMRTGLSIAVIDPTVFPHDRSVELSIIQFAQNGAYLEIGPTIISHWNFFDVAHEISTLKQRNGGTPLACGLKLAADTMYNSDEFDVDNRQVVNIVTDGMPNRDCSDTPGVYTGKNVNYDVGKASAVEWRDYLLDHCSMTEDHDEIDSLAVGRLSGYYASGPDSAWLNSSIIWPTPGCLAPPFDKGRSWVREVEEWRDFYNATKEMFRIIFQGIWVTGEIEQSYPTDPNETNDRTQVLIVPSVP